MARTKTTTNPPPPKVNHRALYPWAPDELLDEYSSLVSTNAWRDHVRESSAYDHRAFAKGAYDSPSMERPWAVYGSQFFWRRLVPISVHLTLLAALGVSHAVFSPLARKTLHVLPWMPRIFLPRGSHKYLRGVQPLSWCTRRHLRTSR